ncbi:hypothetical protein CO180_02730 [candidate division WWE3 bacterium CG_4_9_14_3_um_filter_41_6]|uniref:Uncharacterized protein n=1 Tax=candidate division WWE3 bacterium CG_4_10_14_0_2_um_filter_41_14 TaxID=1975072 RepID=A0A2M7TJJ5_UNCKA|nr:MAG: hypothetical protein COY32_02905 [candidate division WWE3 bacterium CG_4_10_14_0_2_um_filter_41_14]PJA38729.1 MAG: hypothetical protein CO180_02730 [candidate division WWE3 bacterium CG_4_9_14_3_um_filter_41_6]
MKGFTLIELLVVIVIIGLLAGIGIASFGGSLARGRIAKAVSDITEIKSALTRYSIDTGSPPPHDHTWDTSCERAFLISGTFAPNPGGWSGPYVEKWPVNPWNFAYHWEKWESSPDVPDGYTISIQSVPTGEMTMLDQALDDGNLSTGRMRAYTPQAGRMEYYLLPEFTSVAAHTTSCTP